jgi:phage baseplate assembly protein W
MRKDLDLNFAPHPLTGDLAMKSGRSAIDQSVRNLVLTNFYERGFNIEVGSNLPDSLFDNFTSLDQQTIKSNIIRVLKNFEPNVEVTEVISTLEQNNELKVEVYYTYSNDPEVRSTVIPIRRLK